MIEPLCRNVDGIIIKFLLTPFCIHLLQESAPSVTGGVYSPSCTENSFLSAVGLSCRFTSTSSSNITEDCHNQTGREERWEFMDLRLKLAL